MRSAVVLLILVPAMPVLAQEQPVVHQSQTPAHDPLDCYCRARGQVFAPGESVCLKTAEGPKLAECRMVINVMSWSITGTPCPES